MLPTFVRRVPFGLSACDKPVTDSEAAAFIACRQRFDFEDRPRNSAETDKIRAFRLLKGARSYIEIGTETKFNLAYVAGLLAPDAVMVDIDRQANEDARVRLEAELPSRMRYHSIAGDSTDPATRDEAIRVSNRRRFDAVFIDGDHIAPSVVADFALYGELVKPTGHVMFHDCKWEGDDRHKGVVDALELLNRHVPVWQIIEEQRATRFHRPLIRKQENWGGVAIIRGRDLMLAKVRNFLCRL